MALGYEAEIDGLRARLETSRGYVFKRGRNE